MKKILLNIGLPMVLALVLQGCSQSTLSQNDLVTSSLIASDFVSTDLGINEPTSVHAFVRTNKIKTPKSSSVKALEWQKKWKDRVAKAKADRKAKLKTFKTTKKQVPVKKAVVVVAKSKKLKGKGRARYNAIIAKYAQAYGVPIRLAHAVVQVESNYRSNARGAAGEIGLMQLRLATARGIGYRGSAKALYNPETNIKFGMKYLGEAYKLGGGSTCGAILKYNAGHGAKRMNPVSARYCKKVKRLI